MLRFGSHDWRLLIEHSFHVELRNGSQELTAFAEHWRLAIGDFCPSKGWNVRSHLFYSIFWPRRYAERIWGEFFILVRRILGKLPANFSANLIANFDALFFQGIRPPKTFTPKIHVQNCRHSSPISLSRTQNLFKAIFCLRGRPIFFEVCTLD